MQIKDRNGNPEISKSLESGQIPHFRILRPVGAGPTPRPRAHVGTEDGALEHWSSFPCLHEQGPGLVILHVGVWRGHQAGFTGDAHHRAPVWH
jgi:hypothetical protein